ncbi:NAD(P)H-binding protein [Gordonia soli]|uniref:NAD-dependent epimerase/dehydratase family protein n=1 Tax=Gordonia soli NBRC 108243 TaxID=1223545 RepID=M0QES9_9ACTN|nr:NAD(P)H-binding protein [Gordonia soli]GAC66944.1 NAD-dependent epimerase/dehydratase family protein [Gordonia soli NBRC 108243]
MGDTRRCLVTGATGYVGGRLAPRLLARGHSVRALARTPSKLTDAPWTTDDRAQVVRGDLSDRDSLLEAFTDIDVVYHLVHSMSTSSDFAEEERRSAENVVAAARERGVQRIVYLGGLHPPGVDLSEHLASRAEVGEILIDSGIETVALQAGTLIGSGSASFELIRHLTERLPAMTTPRWVHNKIQPIAVADALHYLVESATAPVPTSRTWDIGGPDVLEYGDMMQIYAEIAGLPPRRMIVIPVLTPTVASRWVRLVTPIRGSIARPLIESLECDAICREHDIDDVIAPPTGGLSTYRAALAATLDRVERGDTESGWQHASADVPASEPLPTDPPWAGEEVEVSTLRSAVPGTAESVFESLSHSTPGGARVVLSEPPSRLRVRLDSRAPGRAFIEYALRDAGSPGGSAGGAGTQDHVVVTTTTVFAPRGLVGLLYWKLGTPLRALGIPIADPFR